MDVEPVEELGAEPVGVVVGEPVEVVVEEVLDLFDWWWVDPRVSHGALR